MSDLMGFLLFVAICLVMVFSVQTKLQLEENIFYGKTQEKKFLMHPQIAMLIPRRVIANIIKNPPQAGSFALAGGGCTYKFSTFPILTPVAWAATAEPSSFLGG